jgi:hypothetical protein
LATLTVSGVGYAPVTGDDRCSEAWSIDVVMTKESVYFGLRDYHAPADPPTSQRALGEQIIDGPDAHTQRFGCFRALKRELLLHHGAPQILTLQFTSVQA